MNIDWSKIVSKEMIEEINVSEIKSRVASVRYQQEISGLTIDGHPFYTDRETQMKLMAASLRAQTNPDYSVNWKLADGSFSKFTSNQIIEITNKIADYVQACYERESELVKEIDEGTYTEQMINTGWPNM